MLFTPFILVAGLPLDASKRSDDNPAASSAHEVYAANGVDSIVKRSHTAGTHAAAAEHEVYSANHVDTVSKRGHGFVAAGAHEMEGGYGDSVNAKEKRTHEGHAAAAESVHEVDVVGHGGGGSVGVKERRGGVAAAAAHVVEVVPVHGGHDGAGGVGAVKERRFHANHAVADSVGGRDHSVVA